MRVHYDTMTYENETFKTDGPPTKEKTHQGFIGIQVIHRETSTLETRKVTKLH